MFIYNCYIAISMLKNEKYSLKDLSSTAPKLRPLVVGLKIANELNNLNDTAKSLLKVLQKIDKIKLASQNRGTKRL